MHGNIIFLHMSLGMKLRKFTKKKNVILGKFCVTVSWKIENKGEGCYHCIRISSFLESLISMGIMRSGSGKDHLVVLNPQRKGGCNYHNRSQRLSGNHCYDLQKSVAVAN